MTKLILSAVVLLLAASQVEAQPCATLITEGRAMLVASNLAGANAKFAAAAAACPGDPAANVLVALTRLLTFHEQPTGSNFLSRLGLPAEGRSLYNWTAEPPYDTNGVILAPAGVNAAEATAILRNHIIPALIASGANLAAVTDTNFLLSLSAEETRGAAVTIDYGDVMMLRAIGHALEYMSYTVNSWNLDLQLEALRALLENGLLSVEEVLARHPQLLTFANTNDLFLARSAFTNGVGRYLLASDFICARPAGLDRLFNLDEAEKAREERFRCTLLRLRDSLATPVVLCTDTNYTIYFASQFTGQTPPRALLPEFAGNRYLLGTLPDLSLGGALHGLSESIAEEFIARYLPTGTRMTGGLFPPSGLYAIHFNTLNGRIYALEISADLVHWDQLGSFMAEGGAYGLMDERDAPWRFYRLVDLGGWTTLTGQVLNACSGDPIAGATIAVSPAPPLVPQPPEWPPYGPFGTAPSGADALASPIGDSGVTDAEGYFRMRVPDRATHIDVWANGYTSASRNAYNLESTVRIYLAPVVSSEPANDYFDSPVFLPPSPAMVNGTTCGATLDEELNRDVWYTWTAPASGEVELIVQPINSSAIIGSSVYTRVWYDDFYEWWPLGSGEPNQRFSVEQGAEYRIALISRNGPTGFSLGLNMVPWLEVLSPNEQNEFTAPTIVPFQIQAWDPDGTINELRIETNGVLMARLTNGFFTGTWTITEPGHYWATITALDNLGTSTTVWREIFVHPANDNFADRALIAGSNILVQASNIGATREQDEPFYGDGLDGYYSVWWSWRAPYTGPVTIKSSGQSWGNAVLLAVYTGSAQSSLELIARNVYGLPGTPGTQVSFEAVAGQAYQIAVDGFAEGEFTLQLWPTAPPQVGITSPPDGSRLLVGTNVLLTADAHDPDGQVRRVDFYADGFLGSCSNAPWQLLWTNVPGGWYELAAIAIDNLGVQGVSPRVTLIVSPPNDEFQQPARPLRPPPSHKTPE